MTEIAQNILKTLGYFDLFKYPLTQKEIYLFNQADISGAAIYAELDQLISLKKVFKIDEFYSLQNDAGLAQRRRNGNKLAAEHLKIAQRVARLLSKFPYVKAIAVSGSLSKNFATEKTDIDFFVVTAANRLWIARTFMHLYKKFTFLTGRQNWFCMNYYVDEAAMEIKEKNIFTAIEIVTLLPMYGKDCMQQFMISNGWITSYFPLKRFNNQVPGDMPKGFLSSVIEKIFSGRLGDRVDKKLMHITAARWQRKVKRRELNSRGGLIGMSIDRHFSKPDPKNFQDKVVNAYRKKVDDILQQRKITPSFVL
ncbi:MAG: nucleotidyltransferase domain-containing protein [Ferruginibacter sp.]|nr:nucleotidyltransferase domain-containing protein [Ferruginibacter sp.]